MSQKVFRYDARWLYCDFAVGSVERAWACALDIETWLKVFHAGDGEIEHISGTKGTVGMGIIHNKLPTYWGYRLCAFFEYYIITKINPNARELTCAVYSDQLTNGRRKGGDKELKVSISPTPGEDGFHRVTIQYNMNNKPSKMDQRDYTASAAALSAHFNYYSPKQ